jgi:hypothetical protein
MSIKAHFDQIQVLFHQFDKQRSQIEAMETFFHTMISAPMSFPWILCPIEAHSLSLIRLANEKFYALSIYTTLESLYTEIIKSFDVTYLKNNIYNIKIESFLDQKLIKSHSGKDIDADPIRKILLKNIPKSLLFDPALSPAYSIVHTFIEWRWANAHFSLWSRPIDLTYYRGQFDIYKQSLIDLHDKFLRYLIALKTPWFNTDFDTFV